MRTRFLRQTFPVGRGTAIRWDLAITAIHGLVCLRGISDPPLYLTEGRTGMLSLAVTADGMWVTLALDHSVDSEEAPI